jgi:hypothetical protein
MKTANSVRTSAGGKVTTVLGGERNVGERTADPRTGNIHAKTSRHALRDRSLDLSSTAHSVPKCEENSERGGNR